MRSRLLAAAAAAFAIASCVSCRAGSPTPARPAASAAARSAFPTVGRVDRLDPAFDRLVPPGARIEQLAQGFQWSEGPVWRRDASGGYLLFSDVPANTIYRWQEGRGLSVWLRPSGFAGPGRPDGAAREIGSNGLAVDRAGALFVADHGNRAVSRLDETSFTKTPVVELFQRRRLNSPNDLVFSPSGDLYFTDPPYGLEGGDSSRARQLPFNGVYRRAADGTVTLVTRELTRPNGVALAPDGRTLYVANSDPARALVVAYALAPDGSAVGAPAARGRVVFDATPLVRRGLRGLPDGLRVDRTGHLFATGPGGVLVLTPAGRHLGTIATDQPTANCAFGDDGGTLYITANDRLLRVRTATRGVGF